MIATAEKLLGPYVWGVYDLLVLPPSFPYGGMENPCLTFVTPTLLVRSDNNDIDNLLILGAIKLEDKLSDTEEIKIKI